MARKSTKYNVILACGTAQAEKSLEQFDVVVLVCDFNVGQETGTQFIQRIRSKYPRIEKAIILSCEPPDLHPPEVDEVFVKEHGARALLDYLNRHHLQKWSGVS